MLTVHACLSSNLAYKIWNIKILCLTMLVPWSKITQFAIVAIVRKPHLWSNEENPLVSDDDTTVIGHTFMDNGPFPGIESIS